MGLGLQRRPAGSDFFAGSFDVATSLGVARRCREQLALENIKDAAALAIHIFGATKVIFRKLMDGGGDELSRIVIQRMRFAKVELEKPILRPATALRCDDFEFGADAHCDLPNREERALRFRSAEGESSKRQAIRCFDQALEGLNVVLQGGRLGLVAYGAAGERIHRSVEAFGIQRIADEEVDDGVEGVVVLARDKDFRRVLLILDDALAPRWAGNEVFTELIDGDARVHPALRRVRLRVLGTIHSLRWDIAIPDFGVAVPSPFSYQSSVTFVLSLVLGRILTGHLATGAPVFWRLSRQYALILRSKMAQNAGYASEN